MLALGCERTARSDPDWLDIRGVNLYGNALHNEIERNYDTKRAFLAYQHALESCQGPLLYASSFSNHQIRMWLAVKGLNS